ncbi:MAG: serine/threonine protein kinase, partial [Planctomycetes bacterium]|nr:serine/threonine protein kinase [Planctomycetota bacterium]
ASAASVDARALDQTLARLAVERGLCTAEELDFCRLKQREPRYSVRSLADLLVESESVTRRQMMRLKQQASSGKSGTKLPGYTMIGKLGEGATASVFKARQESLGRMVAVKVLPKRFASNPRYVEQLYAEARMAASLNHPNIVNAFEVGSHGEYHYFVMEIVEGETVHERILRKGMLDEEESLDIVLAVARALSHAHAKGLVHRDVKPKNIIVTEGGVPKLTDLGLARLAMDRATAEAEKGKSLGTPYYMSPEQVRGDVDIGPATDVYSLGASWYFMITGKTAFTGSDSDDIMRRHVEEALVPPAEVRGDITPGVSDVIVKMMAKDPGRRYSSCDELIVELEAWKTYHAMRRAEMTERGA